MDKQRYSANDLSTSCTNIIDFGPVTPEIEVWEICTFETIRQKAAYLTKYLNNYWIFTIVSALIDLFIYFIYLLMYVCIGIIKWP